MLVNSCVTKLDGGQSAARAGSSVSPLSHQMLGALTRDESGRISENNKDWDTASHYLHHQAHPSELYPLVFPTEILITQNPPKLRKVSLKVLDSAGAAEQKRGDYRGERESDENLFTDFSKTQDINGPH